MPLFDVYMAALWMLIQICSKNDQTWISDRKTAKQVGFYKVGKKRLFYRPTIGLVHIFCTSSWRTYMFDTLQIV